MTIRWLLKEGPLGEFQGIAGLEVGGVRYGREEVERIVTAYHSNQFVTRVQNPESAPTDAKRCAVVGCEKRVFSTHAYCTMHRLRIARTGDPTVARKRGPKKKG